MKSQPMELEFVEWLRNRVPASASLQLGIGDDAAVVNWSSEGIVVTSDMLMEGVDFELGQVSPERIGRKCLAVNLSDLAAMAAEPIAAIVSVAFPRSEGLRLGQALYEGMLRLAAEFNVVIAGGDTNSWNGPLTVSVTVLGRSTEKGVLTRSGGCPGDELLVTGHLGGSRLRHQFDFVPRVREAQQLHALYTLHAGIDLSDGLALDLSRLCAASGCGAELELERIPISEDAMQMASDHPGDDRDPLQRALGDGEDFELLLALPRSSAESLLAQSPLSIPITRIGHLTAETGIRGRDALGKVTPLEPSGYVH